MRSKILLILLIAVNFNFGEGFLKTSGKKIIDETGSEFILRGIGLGGWLLQEGYMFKTSGFANSEHEFRNKIKLLVGEEKTNQIYKVYHDSHMREIDVEQLAAWGFNSIRLPMHYNKLTNLNNDGTYFEEGFARIDSLLHWCEKNKIYLILDLHAAPGGQNAEGISDYDPSIPLLWNSEQNKQVTINLWKKLAERYANKKWIGGYDLLNEPNWDLGSNNAPLLQLYKDITSAIRTVDNNHIIFIEGNNYANNFTGLTPPWDNNMVYSFHKYWNNTDQSSISWVLSIRENFNVPLWLGETGENSNEWLKETIGLMEANKIGWATWPLKKIDDIAGPISIPLTPQYQVLLNYWNGQGTKPTDTYAYAALINQFEMFKYENCRIQNDYIDALFRQQKESKTVPFINNNIPGAIFGVNYDFGAAGQAYNDKVNSNTTGSPSGASWNSGGKYRNDGVDIEQCTDVITNGYNVGWIESGEWLKFTVNVEYSGIYDLNIRYAANLSTGKIQVTTANSFLTSLIDLPSTGGWQSWKTKTVSNVSLTAGEQEIYIKFYFTGFNFNYLEFIPVTVNVEERNNLLKDYFLNQNYPNPFNGQTKIEFNLPEVTSYKLKLYDVKGELISIIAEENSAVGFQTINWESNGLSSGIYFFALECKGIVKKIIKSVILN
ncbi:MAG: hypothetical protein Fur0015_03540 [Ignavibacteriales bacterium]